MLPGPDTGGTGGNSLTFDIGTYRNSYDISKVPYLYNPPMVKESYPAFRNSSGVDESRYTDTAQDILGELGFSSVRKGVMVTDRDFVSSVNKSITNKKYKRKLWGFRFLYNPTQIAMGWAMMDGFDPNLVLSGQDTTNVIVPMDGSVIQLDLMLNRISDMKYLDSGGIKSGYSNPYPIQVSNSDVKALYTMGTMLDVEYLLRVINAVPVKTRWRGTTADHGFLMGQPFVTKLGPKMIYNTYINNFQVNHAMFDKRGVPVLSTVSLSLVRYVDWVDFNGSTTATAASTS